jgi:alanine racemase
MPKTESLSRPAFAEIHLRRLLSNLQYLQSKNKNGFFCPMLKANAYGHGDQQVANLLQANGIKVVGVATMDEAIHLRHGGYTQQILVFSASFQACAKEVIHFQLTPVISEIHQLEAFENLSSKIPVHIKINSGMNRMGFDEVDLEKVIHFCKAKGMVVEGVLTHLLCGNDISESNGHSSEQIKKFEDLKTKYFSDVKIQHVYNSDALLKIKNPIYGSRPGIALYGYSETKDENLSPVMELKAKVVSLRNIQKGDSVSYGPSWKSNQNKLIGVLPIGYADGLSRSLSNKYNFLLGDKVVSQVGTICMDYTMVDLDAVKDKVKVGSVISIFSAKPNNTANDIAQKLQTVSYEVLTSVSERIPRFFVD